MALQNTDYTDLQFVDDPNDDLPASRSLDDIRRDIENLEDDRLAATDLEQTRRSVERHLSGVEEGGEAWRATVDEFEPALDRSERDALDRLERTRAKVLSDRQQLHDVPYRSGLPADQVPAAEAKAASLSTRLSHMAAVDVKRAIKAAILFGDLTEQAAWAMLGTDLERRFPSTEKVKDENGQLVYAPQLFRDVMRTVETATGDRVVIETRDRIEGQLRRLNERIAEISAARNAHNPTGNVGSFLASYQFGRGPGGAEQVHQERRYDPAAVRARIGR